MTQSRLLSLLEALASTIIGFGVSALANYLILPHYGMQQSAAVSLEIGLWFTLISLGRGYVLRRLFNKIHPRLARGVDKLRKNP